MAPSIHEATRPCRAWLRFLVTAGLLFVLQSTASASQCSSDQLGALASAQAEVKTLAELALASVPKSQPAPGSHYERLFGVFSTARADRVRTTLSQVAAVTSVGNIQYDCQQNSEALCAASSKTWAWVTANDEYNVHICERFFSGAAKLRGPLLVHELTHFNSVGDTEDHCDSVPACEALAQSNPDKAVLSAASFQVFVFLHRDPLSDIMVLPSP